MMVELREVFFFKNLKECIDNVVFNIMISYYSKWDESKIIIYLEM